MIKENPKKVLRGLERLRIISLSKFFFSEKKEGRPASEAIPPNSRREFFKKGIMTALTMSGLSSLRGSQGSGSRDSAFRNAAAAGGVDGVPSGSGSSHDFAELFEKIKAEASPEELYTFLYALPKGGDLHHHHGGSTLPEDWYRLATDEERNGGQHYFTRYRIENCAGLKAPLRKKIGTDKLLYWININERAWKSLPQCDREEFKALEDLTEEERKSWMSSIVLDRPGEGRNEFFENHWPRLNHLFNNPYLMSELLVRNMKLLGEEGVIYMEPQVHVHGFHDESGNPITADAVYRIYRERINRRDALDTGVRIRFLMTVLRFASDAPERIEPTFDFIYRHRDLWRGINMAGREDNEKGYPAKFTKVFDNALRKYPEVGISIHAGEQDEPTRHIFDTLRLGATRIGHGVNLIDDAETMLLMRGGKFMVEINLISNHLLGYVEDPKDHPFPVYLRQGIPCALSTDDRGMWDSNMTDEYFSAVRNFNLSWHELVKLGKTSLKFSFVEGPVKKQLREEYVSNLETFEKRFSGGDWRLPLRSVRPVTYGYGRNHLGLKL